MKRLTLTPERMYTALVEKDPQFEGQFIAGVLTTGIFCRPTCRARKPKPENVTWFDTPKAALAAGFRPCKVCKPLEPAGAIPTEIETLLRDLEAHPEQRIRDGQLRERGLEPARIRRWFQKEHGMTFHAFQRMVRINRAFQHLDAGETVTGTAFESGYDSVSGFQEAFKKTTSQSPGRKGNSKRLSFQRFSTPIGPMIAVASDHGLCLLEFTDRRGLEAELHFFEKHYNTRILPGTHRYITQVQQELGEYFAGERSTFDVPLDAPGTDFQQTVWQALRTIPHGRTESYASMAKKLGRPSAVRAVARANGMNRIALVIPCHRVIGSNGDLTGYAGGIWRKQWLLDHERETTHNP